jgi:hypothetical protein
MSALLVLLPACSPQEGGERRFQGSGNTLSLHFKMYEKLIFNKPYNYSQGLL